MLVSIETYIDYSHTMASQRPQRNTQRQPIFEPNESDIYDPGTLIDTPFSNVELAEGSDPCNDEQTNEIADKDLDSLITPSQSASQTGLQPSSSSSTIPQSLLPLPTAAAVLKRKRLHALSRGQKNADLWKHSRLHAANEPARNDHGQLIFYCKHCKYAGSSSNSVLHLKAKHAIHLARFAAEPIQGSTCWSNARATHQVI